MQLLGVLIGFTTIMLLLSLVVTGLVQTVANWGRLRTRCTRKALHQFFVEELDANEDDAAHITSGIAGSYVERRKCKGIEDKEEVIWRKRLKRSFARARREVAWSEIKAAMDAGVGARTFSAEEKAKAAEAYLRIRAHISDQYTYATRIVSVAFSFLIAFSLQVSTPDLLRELSTSEELRVKALEISAELERKRQSLETLGPRFRNDSVAALEELVRSHPDLETAIEEVSGASDTRPELLAELGQILRNRPDRDRLLSECEATLDRVQTERDAEVKSLSEGSQVSLSTLDIGWWSKGWCYYRETPECVPKGKPSRGLLWENWIGVLLTGILLTFGAPFWYERLKDLKVFNDALRGEVKKEVEEAVKAGKGATAEELGKTPGRVTSETVRVAAGGGRRTEEG